MHRTCTPPLAGVSYLRGQRTVRLSTATLIGLTTFAAGFTVAMWTIGIIVTAR